jgi:phosphoserine phosphatase
MRPVQWQPFQHIFFDCDSTLSTIEGIDELARLKGKELRVGVLTDKAMNGDLDLGEVYGKRLKAIRPTRGQLRSIAARYWETLVEDAGAVIAALQFLDRDIYIISGGLLDAVRGFGERLGVPASHIRAVELEYNALSGAWWRYHEPAEQLNQRYLDYGESPLTVTAGKPDIIRDLAGEAPGRRLMVGDGVSDLATRTAVDLFVGYGGVVARARVREEAEVFIAQASLAPVLPLAVGPGAWVHLKGTVHADIYLRGVQALLDRGRVQVAASRQTAIHTAFVPILQR